ncbi:MULTISPECIES: ABC transporter permease [unclassified Gemella]|uniref:ABC transporter permease n=1 Tax=unclassified Gemella TaxID=2624949 RepID=UPI001073D97D|nr:MULTISPECIES: ABC transporter permease [unclassified Gemella]MBF0710603.1 ABC transporter permease [Gemella sp. GL1.1]MBF0746418.1 ABC transporter permease [Gemella sp. 19428wG2_WT2a]NYS27947.1 ABC transporter permease [Gemella sp. GL1]TFU60201.1 ABC transporter [Gemella sp. WT2a]
MKEIFVFRINKENSKRVLYNKYIFNSHLIMFLVIVVGAIIFNYSSWLKSASRIQLYLILILILTLMSYLLTLVKIKTFIKKADAVFILPLENKYRDVEKSLQISPLILKLTITVVFMLSLYPIIEKLGIGKMNVISFAISLFIINIVGVLFKQKKIIYGQLSNQDKGILFGIYILASLNFVFINFFNLGFVIALVFYLVSKKSIGSNINWQGAAEYDEERNEKYLKFVNMFTDVPLDSVKVNRRKYLDIVLPKLDENNFKNENTYAYYYIRAFLRQENTVFLLIRLFLLASLFIYGLVNIYATMFIIVSFNYLAIIQLIPLYKKLNESLWFYILPVPEKIKIDSFRNMLQILMLLATLLLIVVSMTVLGLSLDRIMYLGLILIVSTFLNYTLLKK